MRATSATLAVCGSRPSRRSSGRSSGRRWKRERARCLCEVCKTFLSLFLFYTCKSTTCTCFFFSHLDWYFNFAENGEGTIVSPRLPSNDRAKCLSFRYKSTTEHTGALKVLDSHSKELFKSAVIENDQSKRVEQEFNIDQRYITRMNFFFSFQTKIGRRFL